MRITQHVDQAFDGLNRQSHVDLLSRIIHLNVEEVGTFEDAHMVAAAAYFNELCVRKTWQLAKNLGGGFPILPDLLEIAFHLQRHVNQMSGNRPQGNRHWNPQSGVGRSDMNDSDARLNHIADEQQETGQQPDEDVLEGPS